MSHATASSPREATPPASNVASRDLHQQLDRAFALVVSREKLGYLHGFDSPQFYEAQAAVAQAHAELVATCRSSPEPNRIQAVVENPIVRIAMAKQEKASRAEFSRIDASNLDSARLSTVAAIAVALKAIGANAADQRAAAGLSTPERPAWCPDCSDYHARTTLDHEKLLDTLEACEAYFAAREDADGDSQGYHPNPEMRLLRDVRIAKHSVELVQSLGAGGNRPASTDAAQGIVARGPRPDYPTMLDKFARLGVREAQSRAVHKSQADEWSRKLWEFDVAALDHARRNLLGTLEGLHDMAGATVCRNGSAICDDDHRCAECAADAADAAKRECQLRGDAAASGSDPS